MDWEKFLNKSGISIYGVDIGCSGSRPYEWDKLGNALIYLGVDPLKSEIDRLKSKNIQNSSYLDAFVIAEGATGHSDEGTNKFFHRSSAWSDMQKGYDIIKENFNDGQNIVMTQNRLYPHQILSQNGWDSFDIIKIDVDGDDYPIFNEFLKIPAANTMLAVDIECQFHGDESEFGNTFENISRRSRAAQLHLYKLEVFTYSRAELPLPYVHDFPAQTVGGQVLWGDSVFMKDGLTSNLEVDKIIKLIALYGIYELPDCAFELVKRHEKLLSHRLDIEQLKFQLTLEAQRVSADKSIKKLTLVGRIRNLFTLGNPKNKLCI